MLETLQHSTPVKQILLGLVNQGLGELESKQVSNRSAQVESLRRELEVHVENFSRVGLDEITRMVEQKMAVWDARNGEVRLKVDDMRLKFASLEGRLVGQAQNPTNAPICPH